MYLLTLIKGGKCLTMYDVSHTLKVLRVDHGLKQEDLAKELGVSRVTLSLWESGGRSPSKENCEAICDFFNIDMNYLLGFSGMRNSQKAGVEVSVFREGSLAESTLFLPDDFLDKKGSYFAEINKAGTQIAIYTRDSKSLVVTITKF